MATANEIDEIRSTLQRGLENLALSGNLKPLPLRQQAERPLLRSPLKVNRNGNESVNGRVGSIQRGLNNNNGFKPNSYRKSPDGGYEKQLSGRRPVSAKNKATKRSPRDGSYSGTQIYSRVQMHSKPPTGRPKFSRPSSGRSRTTSTAARVAAQKESAERLQRGRTPSERKPGAAIKSPKSINNDGDPKATAKFGKTPKNGFFLYDSENDGEEWCDVEEEHEDVDGEFNPLDHERLPGDGASLDDFDEDDGLDGLDDEDYEDDDSDGYSIASSQSYKLPSNTALSPKSVTSPSQEGTNGYSRSILASRTGSSMLHLLTSGNDDAHPALSPSLFSNVPPTINFVGDGERVVPLPWDLRKLLKWRMSTVTPHVVKNCIARSGFRATKKANEWIGYWGKHMKGSGFRTIKEYQKINHFPGSFQIGRKDRLWKNLYKMQLHYGKKEYNFCPQTFVLPYDLKLLKRAWEDGTSKQKWILKPPASARGIGVRVIHKWSQIPRRKAVIVQKYLSKPYLINGSKFDLRLYVYIPSFDPLRIFVYYDGLTRFATMKAAYSPEKFLEVSRPPWFSVGAQQDCSEFLKYLLDRIDEEESTFAKLQASPLVDQHTSQSNTDPSKKDGIIGDASDGALPSAHDKPSYTLVQNYFGGKSMTSTRCLKCDYVSHREEAFVDIPLAFPETDATSRTKGLGGGDAKKRPCPDVAVCESEDLHEAKIVEMDQGPSSVHTLVDEALTPDEAYAYQQASGSSQVMKEKDLETLVKHYFSPELLSGDNQYHCDSCHHLQDAQKMSYVIKAPEILVLTLMRFSYDAVLHRRCKIQDHVKLPKNLSLPRKNQNVVIGPRIDPEDDDEERTLPETKKLKADEMVEDGDEECVDYTLIGAVVHSGLSSESGHYYCYGRTDNIDDSLTSLDAQGNREEQWCLFNDDRVSHSSFESLSNISSRFCNDTAYVLFYQKLSSRQSTSRRFTNTAVRARFQDMVAQDNSAYLQEQELEAHREKSSRRTVLADYQWYKTKDPDDRNEPPGGCGLGGGGGVPSGHLVF